VQEPHDDTATATVTGNTGTYGPKTAAAIWSGVA
jgi:hypothetical protein